MCQPRACLEWHCLYHYSSFSLVSLACLILSCKCFHIFSVFCTILTLTLVFTVTELNAATPYYGGEMQQKELREKPMPKKEALLWSRP